MELLVSDAWGHLRNTRTLLLRDTDILMVPDRPTITGMLEYRTMLRELPSTYNDTTIFRTFRYNFFRRLEIVITYRVDM